jgi:branched-chain amino acid transport system substrate-binding protein
MNDRRDVRRLHRTRAGGAAICLVVVALLASACGGNRSTAKPADNNSGGTTTPGSTSSTLIDTSTCPTQPDTTGVSGNTVTFGTSLPESGLYAPFSNILHGEQAYFNYVNANGGVDVGGKKYQIKLKDYDDQYIASKTVTNVQTMLNSNNVFGLFNVVGTKNNLAIRDLINSQCVPDLFAASGATQWGNHAFPWLIGSELVPYPLEVKTFVDYLKKTKPNATIAVLKANDDFGQSYADTLTDLVKGTQLKVVKTEEYDNTGAQVQTQVNSLAATKADAFLVAAALLACPAALNAAGDAGWHPITYMSGTCVSKLLFDAAGKNANGVFTVTPLLDPADPKNASNPAMKLYQEQLAKYFPPKGADNNPKEGIVAYGWTTAALLVKTLEAAKSLDRASVMESARHLQNVSGAGLQIPAAKWNTNANDWFVGETYQFIKWDATAGHSVPIGPLTDEDGKTAEVTPGNLINLK